MNEYLLLFLLFEFKHFICDFLLQTKYMLGKFNDKFKDYWYPLYLHASINGCGAFLISIFISNNDNNIKASILIFIIEIILHFIIDRIKASKKLLNRWDIKEKQFWWSLGFDQMLHRICYILYIFMIL